MANFTYFVSQKSIVNKVIWTHNTHKCVLKCSKYWPIRSVSIAFVIPYQLPNNLEKLKKSTFFRQKLLKFTHSEWYFLLFSQQNRSKMHWRSIHPALYCPHKSQRLYFQVRIQCPQNLRNSYEISNK